jgi:hypothetical protein
MSCTSFTDRKSILDSLSQFGYPELARRYKVNSYYLWHIANNPEYRPPRHIANKLNYRRYKPRPRRAINLADPASAAATIRRHAEPEYVAELVRLLEDYPRGE